MSLLFSSLPPLPLSLSQFANVHLRPLQTLSTRASRFTAPFSFSHRTFTILLSLVQKLEQKTDDVNDDDDEEDDGDDGENNQRVLYGGCVRVSKQRRQ